MKPTRNKTIRFIAHPLLFLCIILCASFMPTGISYACTDLPVRIEGATPACYSSLQVAYNAAADGALIKAKNTTFYESFNANRNINITLKGGYNSDYSAVAGLTYIKGTFTTTSGTTTAGNFQLTSAPVVNITSPSGATNDTTPLLTYTVNDGTVKVYVDSSLVSKVSGNSLEPLPEGQHTVRVEATDPTGAVGSATASFTVDVTPPAVSIASPTSGLTNNRTPMLTYTVSDGTIKVKLDGTIISKASGTTIGPLTDGAHMVRVESTDAAGNLGYKEVAFTVDTAPPSISINPLPLTTTVRSQTISGNVETGATVTVSVNTTATPGSVSYPTSSTWACTISGLTLGSNQFTVIAKDAATNSASATASITVEESLSLTGVDVSTHNIDTSKSQTTNIYFNVNGPASRVTLTIYTEQQGAVGSAVYSASQQCSSAGAYFFTWDGKYNIGANSGKVAPDEAYLYVLEATDGVTTRTYNPGAPTTSPDITCSRGAGYDPYKNEPLTITYNLQDANSNARGTINVATSSRTIAILNAVPHIPGSYNATWNGRDSEGKIITGSVAASCTATPLGENIIITSGDTPKISNVKTDPYGISLSYGEFTRIKYTLSREAMVSVTLISPSGQSYDISPSGTQSADIEHEIIWPDVQSVATPFVVKESGVYGITITATNPDVNSSNAHGSSTAWGTLLVNY